VRLLKIEKENEVLHKKLEKGELEVRVKETAARAESVRDRVRQDLRKEILPLEQRPALAAALSRIFLGAHLSVYGQDANLIGSVAPILELLTKSLRDAGPAAIGTGHAPKAS
jgi:hypothetical protein